MAGANRIGRLSTGTREDRRGGAGRGRQERHLGCGVEARRRARQPGTSAMACGSSASACRRIASSARARSSCCSSSSSLYRPEHLEKDLHDPDQDHQVENAIRYRKMPDTRVPMIPRSSRRSSWAAELTDDRPGRKREPIPRPNTTEEWPRENQNPTERGRLPSE